MKICVLPSLQNVGVVVSVSFFSLSLFQKKKHCKMGIKKKKKKKIGEKEDYAYVEFAQFYEAKEWIDGNRPTPLVCGTPVHLDYESTDWRCNHVR